MHAADERTVESSRSGHATASRASARSSRPRPRSVLGAARCRRPAPRRDRLLRQCLCGAAAARHRAGARPRRACRDFRRRSSSERAAGPRGSSRRCQQLVFVFSVSEPHNRNNVQRHPLESVAEYQRLLAASRRRSRSGSTSPPHSTVRSPGACRRTRRWPCSTAWCRSARTRRSACATRRAGRPSHVENLSRRARRGSPRVHLGVPSARHLWPRARQCPCCLSAGGAGFDASFGGWVGARSPGCYRQRRHRGRGLDVRADGGGDRHRPRRACPRGQEGAALPGGQAGGRVRDALLSGCAATQRQPPHSIARPGAAAGNFSDA